MLCTTHVFNYRSCSQGASIIRLTLFRHCPEGYSSNQPLTAFNCSSVTPDCVRFTSSKRVSQSLMTAGELTFSKASSNYMSIKMSSGKKHSLALTWVVFLATVAAQFRKLIDTACDVTCKRLLHCVNRIVNGNVRLTRRSSSSSCAVGRFRCDIGSRVRRTWNRGCRTCTHTSFNLLGQGLLLQVRESVFFPLQSAPPYLGSGLVHVRVSSRIPPPHVTEHMDDCVHELQPPCSAK